MTPLMIAEVNRMRSDAQTKIDVIDGFGAFFKPSFLREYHLQAVIFEGDFRDTNRCISDACRVLGIQDLICFSLDPDVLPGFRLGASHEELKTVRMEYHTPSYAISNQDNNFMLISDSDYYWGLASRIELVKRVTGGDITDHLKSFDDSISPFVKSKDLHNARIGSMLQTFSKICFERYNEHT